MFDLFNFRSKKAPEEQKEPEKNLKFQELNDNFQRNLFPSDLERHLQYVADNTLTEPYIPTRGIGKDDAISTSGSGGTSSYTDQKVKDFPRTHVAFSGLPHIGRPLVWGKDSSGAVLSAPFEGLSKTEEKYRIKRIETQIAQVNKKKEVEAVSRHTLIATLGNHKLAEVNSIARKKLEESL